MKVVKESMQYTSNIQLLLGYVGDLELEVDRLRRQGRFVQHEVRGALKRIQTLCGEVVKADASGPLAEIDGVACELSAVLRDLQESPGYHPAHDQVIAIAIRPLIEQVFRWHQRLMGAAQVGLQLELAAEHIEWFPARFRHIVDNLMSNALKYRDAGKTAEWVRFTLHVSPQSYEIRVMDNGLGLPANEPGQVFELLFRAAPMRASGLGVGLAVVKQLVEQSGGSLAVDSGVGQGSTFVATLPRYDVADYLTV